MYLRSLYLRHFRLYEEGLFEFDPLINVICGGNGIGKTTVLEAIFLLMTGRSFRQAQNSDLIRHGDSHFYLEAVFVKNGLEQTLKLSSDGTQKKIIYNNTSCATFSSLLGLMKGVVLCPDDVALIKSGPVLRRQYLDLQIAQVDPLYVHHLTRYHRAMRQRNHLLRSRRQETIESWEHEMAHSAAYIIVQRLVVIADLQITTQQLHSQLTGESKPLSLKYKTGAPTTDKLDEVRSYYVEQFAKQRKREMELGFTLSGPHKDDLLIALGDQEVRFLQVKGSSAVAWPR